MIKAKLQLLNIGQLREVQILSNTPAYLYKHFKNDPSVRAFAEACSADDFTNLLDSLAGRKRKTGNYQITLYVIAVSLSFKQYGLARPLLKRLEKFDVKWLSRIIALTRDAMVVTQTKTHDLRSQVHSIAYAASNDPTSIITIKQSPTLLTKQV